MISSRWLYFFIFFVLLLSSEAVPQAYGFFHYNDEMGLSSNLVKTVVQDSNGAIWVGTDAGLSIYNGREFISLQDKSFPSIFVKYLFKTSDGRILVITDQGMGHIKKGRNKYYYEKLLNSYPAISDTALYYPKSIFETKDGALWISDVNGITRLSKNETKKYSFPVRYHTDSYFRSFLLAEDADGNIILASWKGFLFKYDKESDRFIELQYKSTLPQNYINQLTISGDHEITIGTSYGLEVIKYNDGFNKLTSKQVLELKEVSSFYKNSEGNYLLGTWNHGAFIWRPLEGILRNFDELHSIAINNIFIDRENGIWMCTDEGLTLVKKTLFRKAEFSSKLSTTGSNFILNLIADEKENIYFSDQETIYKVEPQGVRINFIPVHDSRGKRVLSFTTRNDALWVSYRTGELLFKNRNEQTVFPMEKIGGRLTTLKIDADGNCWGFIESLNKVIKIDKNFSITRYDFPSNSNRSQIVEIDRDGNIFFIYADHNFQVFRYNKEKNVFEKIELSTTESYSEIPVVFDFEVSPDRQYVLASSKGLFFSDGNRLVKPRQEDTSTYKPVVKAIHFDKKNNVWGGTEREIFLRTGNEFVLFNRHDGLHNAVVTTGGIVSDKDNRIWVATSNGLAYWQAGEFEITHTPTPSLITINVNNKPYSFSEDYFEFTGFVNIEIIYSTFSFPNRVKYQTRLLGIKEEWSESNTDNRNEFFKLPPGDYIFQVKAQQSGHLWSNIREFKFTINPPWYSKWWMIVIYIAGTMIGLYLLSEFLTERRLRRVEKEKAKLENLVNEKTKALQAEKEITENLLIETQNAKADIERTNEDLKKANELKNDLLSIAAHDLKNPLSSILGFSELLKEESISEDERKQFLGFIIQSSLNMRKLIDDILATAIVESTKLKLEYRYINLNELVENVISLNEPRATQKGQKIIHTSKEDIYLSLDPKWIRQAVDNIIGNAIKYTPPAKNIYTEVKQIDNQALIVCRDEGPGLTDDDKTKLFRKFQRLSAKPTGGESSTGLGLSFTKDIIELHSGKIIVESEYGKGSTFIIELLIVDRRKTNQF